MKYGSLNLGQIEALVNKIGGMKGVERILSGAVDVSNQTQVVESVIKTAWHEVPGALGVTKEMLGGKSLFSWCCWRRMRRIVAYTKVDGKIRRLGQGIPPTIGFYCEVCERRESAPFDYGY